MLKTSPLGRFHDTCYKTKGISLCKCLSSYRYQAAFESNIGRTPYFQMKIRCFMLYKNKEKIIQIQGKF
jgi:hypothetical protein